MTTKGKPGKFKNSIAFRYLGIASTFLVVIQLLFGLVQIRWNFSRQLANLEKKAEEEAKFLSAVSPEAILENDLLTLERLMKQTSVDSDIIYSIVVGQQGRALTRFLNQRDPIIAFSLKDRALNHINILKLISIIEQVSVVRYFRSDFIGVVI